MQTTRCESEGWGRYRLQLAADLVRGKICPGRCVPDALLAPAVEGWFVSVEHCSLFDHLVGAGEKHWWHYNTKSFGGLVVNNQLEFGRLFDR